MPLPTLPEQDKSHPSCCPCQDMPVVGAIQTWSLEPVHYGRGEIRLTRADLASRGFGSRWGHTRSYRNRLSTDYDFGNGFNWFPEELTYLAEVDADTVVLVRAGDGSRWFDKQQDDSYLARYGALEKLVKNESDGTCELVLPGGRIEVFYDFATGDHAGRLWKTISPGRHGAELTWSAGKLTEVDHGVGFPLPPAIADESDHASFLYDYLDSGDNTGRIESVTLRTGMATSWTEHRRALYTYYGSSEDHGNLGDLKTVTLQVKVDGDWVDVGQEHYRYYKDAAGGIGFQHGLKYAVFPEAYARLDAAVSDPLTATDNQVADYADYYFEYNSDRRVTKEIVAAGSRTYTFAYVTNTSGSYTDAANHWKRKTTETLPGGAQNIVYCNHVGQVLVKEFKNGSDRWIEYQEFDSNYNLTLRAAPSAVNMSASPVYDDTALDLDVQLRSSAGLIHLYDYYDGTSGTPANYLRREKIKQGSSGTAIKLREREYASNTASGVTVWQLSEETVYRSDASGGSEPVETTFAHTYHSGTNQVLQKTTTFPAVPTAQNGENATHTRRELFDEYGHRTWEQGPRGFIDYFTYDIATDAVTQHIRDVDPNELSLPSGWSAESGTRVHLITDYETDALGRTTQVLGPEHDVDGETVRRATWTVYQDADREVWSGQGYGTGSPLEFTLVNPVSIQKFDHDGNLTDKIVATRSSSSGALSAEDSFPQSSWVRWQTSQHNDEGQPSSSRVYHTIPSSGSGSSGTNYDQTEFAHDAQGRQNKQKSPGGTITRTVFDVRGLPVKVFVGTNDTSATDADPTGGGASGNNMKLVQENEYDSAAAGGDGNLTKTTRPVDATAGNDRVTLFGYDWRNRQSTIDGEVDFYRIVTYDNLDRVTKVERKDTSSSGNLISRQETKYDDRGNVYQTIRHAVDPSTGAVGNSLVDNTWYDEAGNTIKHKPAGSEAFIKAIFDSLGRETVRYTGYDTSETSYAAATDVEDDSIFEQVETSYDEASNVLQTTTRRRFHNATGTGELTTPDGSQPKARVSYVALWYDALGRQTAVANYGTNDGSSLSRPAEVPSRSDYILVTTTEYNSDGEAFKTIDPMAREDRQEFNDAGRRTKLIENYDDGDPTTGTSDKDRTTLFDYNADGLLKSLTAKNPTTGDQVTTYVYGTTLTDSEVARADLLRAVIYPDSDDVESPLGDGADSTYDRVEHKYTRQGEVKETKDQNGTIHVFDFDKLGRVTQDRVTTLGTNIDGAVRRIGRTYEVRGLVEKITSYDNATAGSGNVVNEVKLEYNSFGQLVKDYQEHSGAVNTSTTPKVQYDYANGSANHIRLTKMTYPNGRILRYEFNSGADANLSRISFLADDASGSVGTHVAQYSYLGFSHIVQVDYTEPEIRYGLAHGSGDDPYDGMDRFDRIVDLLWRDYGGSVDVERIKHGYDRAGNRLWRECPIAAAQSTPVHQDELYSYEGLYQLATFQRGELNSTKDAITSGTKTYAQEWAFDATGNWASFKDDTNGDGTWELNQTRAHNKANEISSFTGSSWPAPSHDRAGNMTALPQPAAPTSGYSGTYDAWNRLVKLMDGAATVGEYTYDGGTRRTEKIVSSIVRHFYFSANWQDLEERLGASSSADRQFVWGVRYIDDLALRDRDTDSNGTLDERLYGLQDTNWNLTAISDTSGAIVERYRYSVYGEAITLSSQFAIQSGGSSHAWEVRFAGYYLDSESSALSVRNRCLHPVVGRWITRDPLLLFGTHRSDLERLKGMGGRWDGAGDLHRAGWLNPLSGGLISEDPIQFGSGDTNLARYVLNRPSSKVDPLGLVDFDPPVNPGPPPTVVAIAGGYGGNISFTDCTAAQRGILATDILAACQYVHRALYLLESHWSSVQGYHNNPSAQFSWLFRPGVREQMIQRLRRAYKACSSGEIPIRCCQKVQGCSSTGASAWVNILYGVTLSGINICAPNYFPPPPGVSDILTHEFGRFFAGVLGVEGQGDSTSASFVNHIDFWDKVIEILGPPVNYNAVLNYK